MRRLSVLALVLSGCSFPPLFPREPSMLPDSCQFVVRQEGGFIRAGWENGRHEPCRPCVEGMVEVSEDDCGKVVVP